MQLLHQQSPFGPGSSRSSGTKKGYVVFAGLSQYRKKTASNYSKNREFFPSANSLQETNKAGFRWMKVRTYCANSSTLVTVGNQVPSPFRGFSWVDQTVYPTEKDDKETVFCSNSPIFTSTKGYVFFFFGKAHYYWHVFIHGCYVLEFSCCGLLTLDTLVILVFWYFAKLD